MGEKSKAAQPRNIGGQAVIEGVMMRGKRMYALAVKKPDDTIEVVKKDIKLNSDKYKFLGFPIIRGIVSFVDSLVTGMNVIMQSAEMSGLEEYMEEEEPSKFEKYLMDKFGDKFTKYLIYFSVCVAIVISVLLFMVLPVGLSSILKRFIYIDTRALGAVEGIVRLIIFLTYIYLTSMLPDIKRVFMYHGAEHKTINCLESEQELTIENVKKHTRLHKRCGTSFLLIVMLVSMLVFFFVRIDNVALRILSRILLAAPIAGISYEIIKWAGRSQSVFVKVVSAPGMALQLITTKEPDDKMIEVAIAAVNEVLASEPE